MAERSFKRWTGSARTEMPFTGDRPEDAVRQLRDTIRNMVEWLDANNDTIERATEVLSRLRGEYDLDDGVTAGHLVYFSGKRMKKAALTAIAYRPMAVVESVIGTAGGATRGYCTYIGKVMVGTADTSISEGSDVYLSATAGLCTADPPTIDGDSVMYLGPIGKTLAPIDDGQVAVAFIPAQPERVF